MCEPSIDHSVRRERVCEQSIDHSVRRERVCEQSIDHSVRRKTESMSKVLPWVGEVCVTGGLLVTKCEEGERRDGNKRISWIIQKEIRETVSVQAMIHRRRLEKRV